MRLGLNKVVWRGLNYRLLGIINTSVLPPGQKTTKTDKHNKKHPTGYETDIVIKWTSLKIDVITGFHSLFICAKFGYSTISRTKVIEVWSVNASLPMKWLESHKKCSQVEISNLNNFCSIHCTVPKFGTHEEQLEPILLTNFQQKVQNLFHTLLGVFCFVFLF